MKPLLICAALGLEKQLIEKALKLHPHGHNCHVLLTGIGPEQTRFTLNKVWSDKESYFAAVMVGFAGALSPKLRHGDIIVAKNIHLRERDDSSNPRKIMSSSPKLQSTLNESLNKCSQQHSLEICSTVGDLLTVDHVVESSAEKSKWFEELSVIGVEMESYIFLEHAHRLQVPAGVVRVIIDEAAQDLPPIQKDIDEGRPWDIHADQALKRGIEKGSRVIEMCMSSVLDVCWKLS